MTRKSGTHLYATYGALNSCFSALYVTYRCVPDFLVMVISNIIYQFLHSKLYICIERGINIFLYLMY